MDSVHRHPPLQGIQCFLVGGGVLQSQRAKAAMLLDSTWYKVMTVDRNVHVADSERMSSSFFSTCEGLPYLSVSEFLRSS
jgi:hypothetical protein